VGGAAFRQFFIIARLFLFIRHARGISQQEEFRPEQAHAFRSHFLDAGVFMREFHIDGKADVAAVPGDGGEVPQGFQRLVGLFLFHLEAVVVFHRLLRGLQDEDALVPVQDGGGVAFHLQKGLVQSYHGGNAHGAGENGGVGNGGAYFRGKPVNQVGVHRRRVRRGQVVGHQHLGLFLLFLVFQRFRAAEVVDDPLHDVLHVRGLGAQVGIVHAAQHFHVVLHDHIKDVLHILVAPEQLRLDLLENDLVLEKKNMGVKNGGVLFPGYLDHALAQGPDLLRGGLQCLVETHQLRVYFLRRNFISHGFLGPADLNFDLAEGDAGGNGDALKPGFFRGNGVLNHLRANGPVSYGCEPELFNLLQTCGKSGLPARSTLPVHLSLPP
jgi:hypothetical protein